MAGRRRRRQFAPSDKSMPERGHCVASITERASNPVVCPRPLLDGARRCRRTFEWSRLERIGDDRLFARKMFFDIDGPLITVALKIPPIGVQHGAARNQQKECAGCQGSTAAARIIEDQ
jgi:hypothetical protein